MRLCLSLQTKNSDLVLPIHYNRMVQGAIYENISEELAGFLHNQGFIYGNRRFKFFTFSRLLGKYRLDRYKKKIFFPEGAKLYISSPIDKFCTSLMGCMLGDGEIHLGSIPVEINNITVDTPKVTGDFVSLNSLSPVVTYSTFNKPEGGVYTCYFQPGEKEFAAQVEKNLQKKYSAYFGHEAPGEGVKVEPVNNPRMSIAMYKDTIIKGYTCRIDMNGPAELLQVAVDAGLGAKNSQGFGCVEIIQ